MDKVSAYIFMVLGGTAMMGAIITGVYALVKKRKGEKVSKKIVLRIFVITLIFYAIINCIVLFFNTATPMPARKHILIYKDYLMPASDKQITSTAPNPIFNFIPLIIIIGIIWVWFIVNINRNKSSVAGSQITGKRIQETKCTCQACGNIWYYGKQEARAISAQNMANCGNAMSNTGSDMMCCGGCLPAIFIPKRQDVQVKDLNKCPKCNSSAIRKEEVIHEV